MPAGGDRDEESPHWPLGVHSTRKYCFIDGRTDNFPVKICRTEKEIIRRASYLLSVEQILGLLKRCALLLNQVGLLVLELRKLGLLLLYCTLSNRNILDSTTTTRLLVSMVESIASLYLPCLCILAHWGTLKDCFLCFLFMFYVPR